MSSQQGTSVSVIKCQSKGIGPGGWKCACCAPAPGKRKEWFRTVRSRLKRETLREIKEEVNYG